MAKPPADGVVATFAYLGLRGRHSGSSTSVGDGGAGFGAISQPRQQQHRATGVRVRFGAAAFFNLSDQRARGVSVLCRCSCESRPSGR